MILCNLSTNLKRNILLRYQRISKLIDSCYSNRGKRSFRLCVVNKFCLYQSYSSVLSILLLVGNSSFEVLLNVHLDRESRTSWICKLRNLQPVFLVRVEEIHTSDYYLGSFFGSSGIWLSRRSFLKLAFEFSVSDKRRPI